jgi:predicted NACHT family NTPase
MSEQIYDWKRFWCPRSGHINISDGGYLSDPESGWGHHNTDLVSSEAIADIPCLALLGEPGIGKSQAMEDLKNYTEKAIDESHKILPLNLHSYSSEDRLIRNLFESTTFTDWRDGTHRLYIFLDSLDEGLLRIETLATLLVEEFGKEEYHNNRDRLYLRLACRTAVFPKILEDGLERLWGQNFLEVYELAPLRRVDVMLAANANDLDADAFLEEVEHKGVVAFAIKPITLRFLLNVYRKNKGQFPPNQGLVEFYLDGYRSLCEEESPSRLASGRVGNLGVDQRLIIAARIAAATVFANRFAIWTEPDRGDVPDEDICIRELCWGSENANGKDLQVNESAVREALDTGLFSSRGSGRMGWAHQTYAEFLAAHYLKEHKMPLEEITGLIFSSEDPDHKLIPQVHETAAWLSSMRPDVFQKIIKTDPDVLLRSDVPTDASVRSLIVNNLLTQYEEGKLFDRDRNNYHTYAKLKHLGLANQLRLYICDSSKQIDARDLAIDIAEICEVSELQEELANLTLDSSQSIYSRVSAAKALCSIGDAGTRLNLKSLATDKLSEDEDDRLKGYVLQALWPDHLTAEELFQALTPPKKRNFFGAYQMFLDYQIVPELQPHDLVVALNWLTLQGIRFFGYPFENLADAILLKAWENFDLPGVAEIFTKVALVQWRGHQRIITHDSKLQEQFASSILNDSQKRHILIEQAVLIISEIKEDLYFLGIAENIRVPEDIFWMIERILNPNDENAERIWAQLIEWTFNRQDAKQIDAILIATRSNQSFQEVFMSYFQPIELNSTQADELRSSHLRTQKIKDRNQNLPLLDPPPKERVLLLLEKLEAGDLSAWWQLNLEMTLKPESKYYGKEFELDLTKLPGWQEAEDATRRRIIEGAKHYVQQQDDIDYEWIGRDIVDRPSLAGCRALQLLLQKNPDFIDKLSSEIWKKWAPIIIAAPSSNQLEESYQELVKLSYLNASEESIETLISLVDKENQKYDYLPVIDHLNKCWNEPLKLALLEKVKDPTLKPKCVGQLLEELLKRGLNEARDFAKSLIYSPLPLAEDGREKTLIAARVLIVNSDPSSWSFIWQLIQQDSLFGREVLELAVSRYLHGIQLNLSETQLADLYVWLVRQYPHDEDPDHSNEELAYNVTARDNIARTRDSVLSQLKEQGTLQACAEIQRLIQELPDITWLRKTLIDAQASMRRKTWKPLQPEALLQLVANQNLSISDSFNRIEKLMVEQSNPDLSGATFNAPVNFAPNYGNQAQNLNIQNTEQNFEVILTDFKQFVTDLQTQHPDIDTLETATQTITVQANQLPQSRLQNFLNLKRLWNGSKKAGLKVGEHFAESNVWGKGAIAFLEGVSEDV